jgi:hypothetical protein
MASTSTFVIGKGDAQPAGTGLRGLMRRHPFAVFYIMAVAFPTLLFTYLIGLEVAAPNMYGPGIGPMKQFQTNMAALLQSAPVFTQHRDSVLVYLTVYASLPLAAPFFFFPFGPTAAALIVTSLARGRDVVAALLSLYLPLRGKLGWRDGARIYGTLLLAMATLIAASLLYESLLNGGERNGQMVQRWGLADPTLFAVGWLMALFTNQGGLLEELGWRGYAWPVLVRKLQQPLVAAVVLGTAWALWHLPREIVPILTGQFEAGRFLAEQAMFIASCIGMTVVAVAFVNHAGGSVLPAIMVHGTLNYLYQGFETSKAGVRSSFTWEPVVLWLVAGAVTLLVVGRDLGWKRRMAIHGGDGSTDPSLLWAPART